jgi:hypothetical protein
MEKSVKTPPSFNAGQNNHNIGIQVPNANFVGGIELAVGT